MISNDIRNVRARIIFAWLFVIYIYFFLNHSLLSQLKSPVLIYPGSDNAYWLIHLLQIPRFIFNHPALALSFDVIITTSCIITIFVPSQKVFTRITILGTWLFYMLYCTAAGKHYAQIGFLIPVVAFWVINAEKFELSWEAVRYWVCFLYASAGMYKIYYGGVFHADNMVNILQQMNADWLLFHTNGFQQHVIMWLMTHKFIAQSFFILAVAIDLAMIVGFFTKRFDRFLLAGLLLFHTGNYFLLHISFIEQSLIFAPFLPWHLIDNYFQSDLPHD